MDYEKAAKAIRSLRSEEYKRADEIKRVANERYKRQMLDLMAEHGVTNYAVQLLLEGHRLSQTCYEDGSYFYYIDGDIVEFVESDEEENKLIEAIDEAEELG